MRLEISLTFSEDLEFLSLILQIASAKSRSSRGASHQPADMGRRLLVTRICPVFLVDEFSPCVLWPLLIELMVVPLDAPLDDEYHFPSIGGWYYPRVWVWHSRAKLSRTASGKWNGSMVSLQGFAVSYLSYWINRVKHILMA